MSFCPDPGHGSLAPVVNVVLNWCDLICVLEDVSP